MLKVTFYYRNEKFTYFAGAGTIKCPDKIKMFSSCPVGLQKAAIKAMAAKINDK